MQTKNILTLSFKTLFFILRQVAANNKRIARADEVIEFSRTSAAFRKNYMDACSRR
jgi:hypothetical protein